MVARSLHVLVCLALVGAQLPIFWATYACSMTGRRHSAACCCVRAKGCDGEGAGGMARSIRSRCCTVTHHRLPAPSAGDLAAHGNPWRQTLDGARLVALFAAALPGPSVGELTPGWSPLPFPARGSPGGGDVPLFLAHRALLI